MTEKLPLVAMVITAVSCGLQVSSGEPCYHVGSNDYTEYDTETQLCCYGVVYQKNQHLSQGCCGEAGPYNMGQSKCCGNDILPMESPLLCCNNRIAYNDSTHICCGPKIHEREGEGEICCGRQPMNPREQTCCPSGPRTYAPRDGTGHCCGTDKVYTPQTQICCEAGYPPVSAVHNFRREDRGEILCCGVNFYAPSAQLCCNGMPRQKHAHAACCGDQTYDMLSQVCCDGRVSDIVNGKNKCCGEVAFNPTIEQCCLFNVSPLANGKCCSTESYHPSESSCCHGQIHHGVPEIEGVQKCCGSVSYLETEQMCCNGELVDQQKDMNCCGKEMYNTTTHLCCLQSKVIPRKTSATQCCGSGVFESTSETCCERANRGFPVVDGKCCHQSNGEVVAYDPRQATCCSGRQREQLYPGTATSDAKCCGWYLLQPDHLCDVRYGNPVAKDHSDDDMVCSNPRNSITYNSNTEVCTVYGRVMLKGDEQRICRHFLLDPNTHICCQGMVHTKYDTYGNLKRCCPPSVHAYVEEFQSCCAGRVANIPTNVAACCRNTPYDTTTHTCDQSGIARPTEEVERYPNMCGFEPYHPDEHDCCEGQQLVGQGETCCSGFVFNTSTEGVNTGQCCGIVGFNPSTHVCCGEYLHHRENAAVTCCGDEVWDSSSTEEICCDGVLQPVPSTSGDRTSCSGQLAYNTHRETVCDGVRHLVPHGHCCGQRLFHPELQICCDGLVHQKNAPDTQCCGTLPYNTTDMSTLCCHNSTIHYNAEGKRCCGNQAMDTQQKQCCTTSKNPFIYKTSKEEETCCSSNTAQDTCCHGNLHLNIKDGECCGSAVIRNQEREMCCEGVKVLKEFGEYSICCGQDVIDSRLYSCCNGRAASKHNQGCCNNQVFYTAFQACCGGEVYYIHNRNTQCCNSTLYDPSVQGCCAQRLYARGKFECCAGAIFDGANQVCQDGKIGDRERRHSTTENPLCAGNTYNEDKEGCCGGVIYDKKKLGCCGDTIYNPIKAVCCGNVISYKRNGACCGPQNRAYNSQRAICCNGVVRKKPSQVGETQCCGTKAYQNETQICCESKIYFRTSDTVECCGKRVFSSDTEICCKNSKIVDTDSSYLNPYCYTKLYDAASDAVSEATVWVQKVFSRSPGKRNAHRGKQHHQN